MLVTDDPVFFARFESLEEPFLHLLHRFHSEGLESAEERVVFDAYESWVRILVKLPLWPRWQEADSASAFPADGEGSEYRLYSEHGSELTSLYPVDLAPADLEQLTLCLSMLVEAGKDRNSTLGQVLYESQDRTDGLLDAFQRVLGVLLLPSPRQLLAALSDAAPQGRTKTVTLTPAGEIEYRRYCGDIVHILSSGDRFAYQSHRAMYP